MAKRGITPRFDGFTPRKRRRYLKTLAKTGCKSDAARAAGISTTTADRWNKKDPDFARACKAAIDRAGSHIELLAWERAVTGIEEPVWHYGKLVGTRMKRSESIFRMLLIASNKKKYGRMGIVRRQIEAELRAKVEAEVKAKLLPPVVSMDEVRSQLVKGLTALGARLRAEDEAQGGEGSGGDGSRE